MGAIVKQEQPTVPAVSESAAIIQVIERAAMNPNVDIDKMERLLQMQERIMERQAKAAYDAAYADMQNDLPEIVERGGIKDRNGNVQSKYALWEDINEAIKPVLAKHGFGISFRTGQHDGRIVVTGVLSHRDGHREETTMELPTDTSGSKNAVQAVGSSTSYGKRYTAQALLNLTSRGEDDDGQAAGAKVITAEQRSELQEIIEKIGGDVATFCQWAKVDSLAAVPSSFFDKAKQALVAKAKQKGIEL
ncbi:ERF family protein [Sinorhizobium fredii]|uniref:ERF family protein n=1 Tax=Rhizobium fredii TaxID=380 RepID=A0A2A6LXM0_RHIFR|nr:ERF family protein [Sinorhizobium fredii]PDT47294.1 ERF family protein [Sinorhizobium fredii]